LINAKIKILKNINPALNNVGCIPVVQLSPTALLLIRIWL